MTKCTHNYGPSGGGHMPDCELFKKPARICIVIPMYGKPELTRRCVDLCGQNAGIEHDIIVVDDGSPEPMGEVELKTYGGNMTQNAQVLRLEENSGFTAATNAGILWCSDRYDYIHLMNNDTEPKEDFLKILYDVLEKEEGIGIAGSSRIVDHDGKQVYELVAVDLVSGFHSYVDEEGFKKLPELIHTHWFPLCSALIRHELIREIGLLDKRMRMWCSDNDFCVRANFAGWNTTLVPTSKVYHIHQATTGKVLGSKVKEDQDVLMNKIMNVQYAILCDKMPLDSGSKTYGKVDFKVYKK